MSLRRWWGLNTRVSVSDPDSNLASGWTICQRVRLVFPQFHCINLKTAFVQKQSSKLFIESLSMTSKRQTQNATGGKTLFCLYCTQENSLTQALGRVLDLNNFNTCVIVSSSSEGRSRLTVAGRPATSEPQCDSSYNSKGLRLQDV